MAVRFSSPATWAFSGWRKMARASSSSTGLTPCSAQSGANHGVGLVPDPGSTSGTIRFLCESSAFSIPNVCYVAKTPGGGIAAMSGTTPGSASCEIYKVVSGSLVDQSLSQTVYNLNNIAIPGNAFITIHQDAYGNWWVPSQGFQFGTCP